MTENDVVILSACRTPIGSFLGDLSNEHVASLGAATAKDAVKRAKIDSSDVDAAYYGHVLLSGAGQNPAKQVVVSAGLPNSIDTLILNKVCASGMAAIHAGANDLRLGEKKLLLVGGMESMSQAPHVANRLRKGRKLGDIKLVDSLIYDGLWCCHNDQHMGSLAELLADKYEISRREQDEFSLESHKRAVNALKKGWFEEEITPVKTVNDDGDEVTIANDEGPRPNTSIEKLSKLKPVFKDKGTVTAGNSSTLNDGAASLVITTQGHADELGVKPLAKINAYSSIGNDPQYYGIAPVNAVNELLKKTKTSLDDYDLIEENEAFAAQTLAVVNELGLDAEKTNTSGGAIALGHPLGCTGARLIVTLLHNLKREKKTTGLATLCHGGGGGTAMSVELL